jgi:hypothetical protein
MKTRPPGSKIMETAQDILEREGLSKKTGETVRETLQRVPAKFSRAREIDAPDSRDREDSVMASASSVGFELQDGESRQARMQQDIPRDYAARMPVADIAADWGITRQQVYNILKKIGVTPDRIS